jgi:hypothetical protein
MSAYFFSFPLDAKLQQTLDDLLTNHAKGQYADASVPVALAVGTTDGVIKALALDVIDILKTNGEGAGILGMLANLLKSTMHTLIKQIMGKVSNAEQDKLAAYLSRRRVMVNGTARFGFSMPDAVGSRFESVLKRIAAGDMANSREDLTTAMNEFVNLSTACFYDEFTGALELGFVKQKMVNLGRSAILKGSQSAVAKLFVSMSDDDLKRVCAHYDSMFVKA